MQKLQRKVGRLLPRSADDAEVALSLKDFDEGDRMLKIIIEAVKAFRVSWTELVQSAAGMATDFESLYEFIPGDDPDNSDLRYRPTKKEHTAKVQAYKNTMVNVRDLMIQEVQAVERSVGMPAKEARKHIEVYRKMVKRREDKKLDWERYKSRTEAIERASTKSERDARALMKHQIDLEVSEQAYTEADGQIKETLPQITKAIYDLLPRLVNAHAMISNTMFGHYYTALHDYCQEYGYPLPSSNWKQVQSEHTDAFARARQHIENKIPTIQKGQAVKSEFASRSDNLQTKTISHKKPIGLTGNGALPPPIPRPGQSHALSPPSLDFTSKPTRTVSNTSYSRPSPPPSVSSYHTATDYFNPPTSGGANRGQSQTSTPYLGGAALSKATSAQSVASVAASIASKKKPPPPPPKRKPSNINFDYVIALYDFPGQDPGDLPFREGDKIRVTKRTDSNDDWWDGELRGKKGSFPANYCKNS